MGLEGDEKRREATHTMDRVDEVRGMEMSLMGLMACQSGSVVDLTTGMGGFVLGDCGSGDGEARL